MWFSIRYQFPLFCCYFFHVVVSDPTGCTYFPTEVKYECTARSWVLPLNLANFNHIPQVLHLIEVNGELPSAAPLGPTFSGFSAINSASFDQNVVPSLIVMCVSGGSLIMSAGTFADMSHVKEMKFIDCNILNLPNSVFSDIGTLNFLGFEGGSIEGIGFDAFKNLDIFPMSDLKIPLGTLSIKSCAVENGQLPNGVLFNLPNIRHIVLDQASLTSLQRDMFLVSTNIMTMSLNHNIFNTLNSQMIQNLPFLHHVQLRGISWDCTCDNFAFLNYLQSNNITYRGDILCSNSTSYSGTRPQHFYNQNCLTKDVCGIIKGIVIGDHCLPFIQMANVCVLIVCLLLSCISLGILVRTKRRMIMSRDAKLMRALGLLKPNPNKNEKLPVKKDMPVPEVSDC